MSNFFYKLHRRAEAIEMLHDGMTVKEVATKIGCGSNTVSRWYLDYLGYRGKEGITITIQSKKEDITENDDNIEYQ